MKTIPFAAPLVGAVAASAAAAAVPWNPSAPENRTVIAAFNHASVEGVLDSIGARHQRSGNAARPGMTVIFANGSRAALTFGNCDRAATACLSCIAT